MKNAANSYWAKTYSDSDWTWMKVLFILGWSSIVLFILYTITGVEQPKSVCQLLNCEILSNSLVKGFVLAFTVVLSISYLCEKYMVVSLTGLSFISVLLFSVGESNGIPARCELLSAILIAQLIAYLKNKLYPNIRALQQNRVLYSTQIIGAAYILAAITKLQVSGIGWISQAPQLAISAKVGILRISVETGWVFLESYATSLGDFLYSHPKLCSVALLISLVIELCGFFCFLGKTHTQVYGLVLLVFHSLIFIVMFVFVPPILLIVLVFLVNVPALTRTSYFFLKRLFVTSSSKRKTQRT